MIFGAKKIFGPERRFLIQKDDIWSKKRIFGPKDDFRSKSTIFDPERLRGKDRLVGPNIVSGTNIVFWIKDHFLHQISLFAANIVFLVIFGSKNDLWSKKTKFDPKRRNLVQKDDLWYEQPFFGKSVNFGIP